MPFGFESIKATQTSRATTWRGDTVVPCWRPVAGGMNSTVDSRGRQEPAPPRCGPARPPESTVSADGPNDVAVCRRATSHREPVPAPQTPEPHERQAVRTFNSSVANDPGSAFPVLQAATKSCAPPHRGRTSEHGRLHDLAQQGPVSTLTRYRCQACLRPAKCRGRRHRVQPATIQRRVSAGR